MILLPSPPANFEWGNRPDFAGGPPPDHYDAGLYIELELIKNWPHSWFGGRTVIGKLESSIHFETGTVLGRDSFINPSFRGRGLIPHLSWNRARLLQRLGLRRIIGVLGRETGAYVWSRFGYRLAPGAVASAVTHVRRKLSSSDLLLLPDEERANVEQILSDADEDFAYRTAGLGYTHAGQPLGRWLLHRANLAAEFDLREGSLSWARARQYRRAS